MFILSLTRCPEQTSIQFCCYCHIVSTEQLHAEENQSLEISINCWAYHSRDGFVKALEVLIKHFYLAEYSSSVFHVPKYKANIIAAPTKAPRVWKKKNNGNFLQGSLPSKHSVKVTAGFRWPPEDEKNMETVVYFYTCISDQTLCDPPGEKTNTWRLLYLKCMQYSPPPRFPQWARGNSSKPTVYSVIAVSVKSC